MKQIIIDIAADGTTNVEAVGFKGKGCADATQQIEIAIGGAAPKKRKMKPEAFVPTSGQQKTRTF